MPTPADALTTYYAALLDGSYDCVDRIVLNANFGLCYSPGGFRSWWRVLHNGSDAEHLMRMAGRFSRRVRGWAQAHGVPVIPQAVSAPRVVALAAPAARQSTVC